MFSTEIALSACLIVTGLSLILAILCWLNARRAASHSANCHEWVKKVQETRDPTTAVAELSTELTELADSYHALLKSHKRLRSRITMRENREKGGKMDSSELSSTKDKRELRLAAKSRGLLK